MMHAALLVALLAAQSAIATPPPIARERTGQGLLTRCEKYAFQTRPDGTSFINESDIECHYYVVGFLDAFDEYQLTLKSFAERSPIVFGRLRTIYEDDPTKSRPLADSLTCLPSGVAYDQVVKVIVKYLQDHPEKLHRRGKELALEALSAAFPCPKVKPAP